MSDDNNNEDIQLSNGVPTGFAAALLLALLIAIGAAFYLGLRERPACVQNDQALIKQAESNIAFAKVQQSNSQRVEELQLQVVKACVDKGNIPVFVNNNIDCKVPGK